MADAGKPRNAVAHALHGFLTRDGISPAELLRLGREELARYGVEVRQTEVCDARCRPVGFEVLLATGERLWSRKLLLATGVVDDLPSIEGFQEFYGHSVFHCPYCDGWEVRDQPLAVYGRGRNGAGLALSLKTWSTDVVLCTDGPARLRPQDAAELTRYGIEVREAHVSRLEGSGGMLERVLFKNGDALPRRALFFSTGNHQRSEIPLRLGCEFTEKGAVRTNRHQATRIPGLYVAGDASHDVQFAIVAAAEGVKAATAINQALQQEEVAGKAV